MKLTKKLLLAAAVMMAASFGFMGCGADDDDDNNMITKDNSDNFTIDYDNTDTSVSRGYKTTSLRHNGGLVQLSMTTDSKDAGAMGYIFDLEENPTSPRTAKENRRFCIVGFNYTGSHIRPYVSLYKNVVDIQLQNFGATGNKENVAAEDTAVADTSEEEYLTYNAAASNYAPADASIIDGSVYVTVDVYPTGSTWNDDGTKRTITAASCTGGYTVDIYDGKVTGADIVAGTATRKHSVPILADHLAYETGKAPTKQYCAAYANVYGGKKLTGAWTYKATYAEAEVIEDAE